ncbi:MAG: hypothetical protein A2297_08210 [Elusimicrobia bacterium RIFOXYB2_FULL_48_7]|nr:MAG: hypothetical protein A2297_08210 [Elusimicrobia bacterium RIFOXYB2_FULL_48_7]
MNLKQSFTVIPALAVLLMFSACTRTVRQQLPPIRVALLPMENQTTNMDGPRLVREKFYRRMLEKYGYITQPLDETDVILREMGITDAGQLNAFKPQDVGAKLGVDAMIYGNLIIFKPVRVALGDVMRVNYRMIEAGTGETMWQFEDGITALSKIDFNDSVAENLQNLFKRAAVEKIVRIPLDEETYRITLRAVRNMPRR